MRVIISPYPMDRGCDLLAIYLFIPTTPRMIGSPHHPSPTNSALGGAPAKPERKLGASGSIGSGSSSAVQATPGSVVKRRSRRQS